MADLNALYLFAKVVEAKSFSEASRRLKMPVSTVSRRIAELENELGARLLERSTRSLRLTQIGRDIFDEARRTVAVNESVEQLISSSQETLSGKLRLSAPPSISDSLLAPVVCAFQDHHPAVRVEVHVTEQPLDHVIDGIDLTFHVGPTTKAGLAAQRLLRFRHQLVATPAYVASRTMPQRPKDLLDHRLLAFSHFQPEHQWTFRHADRDEQETVTFVPQLGINDFAGVTTGILCGTGIGDLSPIVQPHLLREGRLIEIMADWLFPLFDLSLVHLRSPHPSRMVQAFKDFAAEIAPRLFPDLPA